MSEVTTTGASLWLALEQSGALTRTSLTLPPGVDEDELLAITRMLDTIKKMNSFATGDILLYAKDNHGDEAYIRIIERNGWNFHSCENTMSICRRVRPSVRREGLSFGHHDVVRKLLPNEQRHWLKVAEENEWTRQRLRDEIYGERVLPPAVNGNLPQIVQDALSGAKEMMDGWWISRDSYVRLKAAVEGEE